MEKTFFDQPIKNNKVTSENIKSAFATGLGNYYTTGCLLDYPYFRDSYKMIAVDLSKQQILKMVILEQFNKLILQQI